MRLALGIVAALALAACQVDVEGAVCREPGATADCPARQACGNDRRCSERALSCAATRCTPGPVFCAATDGAEVEQCVDTDPVCGARVKAACQGRLGDAIAAAAAHAQATGARATVTVHGAAGADVVFGAATDETFPIEIPAGVALVGASPPAGATIVRPGGAAATVMVVQGSVERIRIEAAEGSVGVATSCLDAATRPSLAGVEVIGGGTLTTGIEVAGGDCGAALTGLDVSGASGPALSVVSNVGVPVTVERSRFRESGTGIRMTGGKLTVGTDDPTSAVEVSGNLEAGIFITGGGTVDVTLNGAAVNANGGTGVVLELVGESSGLAVRGCAVYGNGKNSARKYGPGSPQRSAGGVFIRQGSLASFSFTGNRLSANAGDQLAFDTGMASTWSISPGECGDPSNLFACVGSGYAVSCAGGTVDASFSVWPEGGYNWENFVSAGVTSTAHCNGAGGAPAPPATCPSP